GNTTISGVADGVNADDAVNISQLENTAAASKTEVVAGTNTTVDQATGTDGQDIYTVNAKDTTVTAGDGVTVTDTDLGGNVTDYQVALNQTTKDSLDLADSALQSFTTQVDGADVKTLNDGDNANFVTGKNIALSDDGAGGIEIATADNVTFSDVKTDTLSAGPVTIGAAGINAGNTTISGVADGVNADDAVNISQLENTAAASKTEVVAGTNTTVDQATGTDGQDIYTVNAKDTTVTAGDGVTVTDTDLGGNVTDYQVALNQTTKDSLDLADSALQTVVTQIDGTTVKTLDENDNVANFKTGQNIELIDDAGSIKIATADDVTFTNLSSDTISITDGPTLNSDGIDMGGETITGLGDGVNANDAVNLSQLENTAAASKTEVTGGTNIASVDKTTGADGQDIYEINADGATVTAGDGVTVTDTDLGGNVTDYQIALNQTTKDSLDLADSAMQSFTTQVDGADVKTLNDGDNANFVTGKNIALSDDGAG
ncbi:beta strand repeat-containing protein, partial [Vreelandella alkaliphila]